MKIVLIFILTSLGGISLLAQQTVSATGSNATGSGGTASCTVGQVVCITNTGSNGSVAQGVQQPFEISVLTSLKEATGISLQWSAYPNPTNDFLTLSLQNSDNPELKIDNMSYQLYDMYGKLLLEKRLDGNETTILMGVFTPATYFLKIFQTNYPSSRDLKTFKIIKY